MMFVDEVAAQIWDQPKFKEELALLDSTNFIFNLPEELKPYEPERLHQPLIARLLQAANIFAATQNEIFREVAQRISTAALRLGDADDRGLQDVYALVQSRLSNFPALSFGSTGSEAPKLAPLTLQYEFVQSRQKQTIQIGGDDEHLLTAFQLESWNALNDGKSATITGPTSAGKSYVLLLYIVERYRAGNLKNAVYVVPTRALINQVAEDVVRELERREVSNVQVTTVPVDMGGDESLNTLYVFTQERLEALLISNPEKIFDLVIVDEAQVISHGTRGVLLEAVLDRLNQKERVPQIIFVGPMISNPSYFGEIMSIPDFQSCTTAQSPVTQKIVFLDYSAQPRSMVAVSVGRFESHAAAMTLDLPMRLLTDSDRLSYLSYAFGRSGSSIVYCHGKADAEKVAIKIADQIDEQQELSKELLELIKFVKKHVHPDYALVATLKKGVGFHYGHMPSLLRKELEHCFKEKNISFLACTSTLLYGLNLPAKNIFLSKPTTGRGSPISGPDFWNLAGRVGRLGKELEGDVYLIDYDDWSNSPVSESKRVEVVSALKSTVVDNVDAFIDFIGREHEASESSPEMEMALGKLVVDFRQHRIGTSLDRYKTLNNSVQIEEVGARVREISGRISLPSSVIDSNIGVSPFRLQDLYTYMIKRLPQVGPTQMIPAHPLGDFSEVLSNYRRVFKRIHTYLLKYSGSDRRHQFFAPLALRWMRGDSLPVLINSSIKHYRATGEGKSTASIIRNVMENIENDLRFRYVKFFGAYNAVLKIALENSALENYIDSIPDIPLFLEMGGSSGVMINLMALGLSRTTAESLSEYVTDKDLTVPQIRQWLSQQDLAVYDLSPAILREIDSLVRGPSSVSI